MLTTIIMPILALVIGLLSLSFDIQNPNSRHRRLILGILISGLLVTCVLTIVLNVADAKTKQQEADWNRKHITDLTEILKSFKAETEDGLEGLYDLLASFGWEEDRVVDLDQVKRSLAADQERSLLSISKAAQPRSLARHEEPVTVQYFPKDVDGDAVRRALEELDFVFETGSSRLQDSPTNTIWFGSGVDLEDVKLVAFTLMRAGVDLRSIKPFREPGGSRARLVQVGFDGRSANLPPLSVAQVRDAAAFPSR